MPHTMIEIAKVIPKKVQFISITFVKWSRSKPTHPVTGPGKTGRNEPMIPRRIKMNPRKSKKMSIGLN